MACRWKTPSESAASDNRTLQRLWQEVHKVIDFWKLPSPVIDVENVLMTMQNQFLSLHNPL